MALKIADILSEKGTGVITIAPDAKLSKAVALLAEHVIGALIIGDDTGKVLGILSERDVVAALYQYKSKALGMKISAVMTRTIVTCRPDSNLEEVTALMTKNRFRQLPVVENGILRGIVSIGDIVKFKKW